MFYGKEKESVCVCVCVYMTNRIWLNLIEGNYTNILAGEETYQSRTSWYGSHMKNASHAYMSGGVGMCSTEDHINWKFEGIGKFQSSQIEWKLLYMRFLLQWVGLVLGF